MLDVLYEDNHLLVVNKPAMLPTMGVAEDRPSLLTLAKEYMRQKYNKPGNVYLGIVSRLDAPVTGVVLLARTSKAAGRLSEQFRERDVEKSYWAIVEGRIEPREGRWSISCVRTSGIGGCMLPGRARGGTARRVELSDVGFRKETGRQGDKEKPMDDASPCLPVSLVSQSWPSIAAGSRLLTGRKHQIRVQLSHAGFPIVGDRKYGSRGHFRRESHCIQGGWSSSIR